MESYLAHTVTSISSIWNNINLKLYIGVLASFVSFFLSPAIQSLFYGLMTLVVFDFVTGLWASIKTGKAIRSTRMIKSAFKLLIYCIMLSTGHLLDTSIGIDVLGVNLERIFLIFIMTTEAISVLENVGNMGFPVPAYVVKYLKGVRDIDRTKPNE